MHINCDVGEGLDNEHLLMPHISSCNIACGGHAGDIHIMDKVVILALDHNVEIGAHPSYPDKVNFGRVSISISDDALINSIRNQIWKLQNLLRIHRQQLSHIKAHGALYNDIAKDKAKALLFLKAIAHYKKDCKLYAPYQSVVAEEALKQGFSIFYEAFADRNYEDDLSLVSRQKDNALITDPRQILDHLLLMQNEQKVKTISGKKVPLKADTFCVHSDTENAPEIVRLIHNAFF